MKVSNCLSLSSFSALTGRVSRPLRYLSATPSVLRFAFGLAFISPLFFRRPISNCILGIVADHGDPQRNLWLGRAMSVPTTKRSEEGCGYPVLIDAAGHVATTTVSGRLLTIGLLPMLTAVQHFAAEERTMTMTNHSRRAFLADVGRGMLVASVGAAIAADLELVPAAFADDKGPGRLSFG